MNILDYIGNTPLVELKKISKKVRIFAKAEFLNPSGSIKDRIVKKMIERLEKKGLKKKGIIEVTSGNTGISLAFVSSVKGLDFTAVMPKNASRERKLIIRHFGGKIIEVEKVKDFSQLIEIGKSVEKEIKGVLINQFQNVGNVEAQMELGNEIIRDLKNIEPDAFVAGIGTGGTLVGVGKVLKKKFSSIKIFGVEAAEKFGKHKIEGISDGFMPPFIKSNIKIIDGFIRVKSKDAINMAKKLAKKEGLFVGISSGANVYASLKVAKEIGVKIVVTVLPDRADRYFSTELFGGD
ncbi:MAG: cysteine synthase family protein [Candidatus Aenigmarchaeota archaeon]|nr:cysteine synthase family protein [Candidatus Aenigmarchaeota archaeon]